MPGVIYPLINGHRYSFASIEAVFNGIPLLGFKSINYEAGLEPGELYGTDPNMIGRTRGKKSTSCDFEMYRIEAQLFMGTLGAGGIGFGETAFNIIVVWAEPVAAVGLIPAPVITDTIIGCRVKKVSSGNAEGTDGSTLKFECSIFDVAYGNALIAFPNKVAV